ncbi:hypothetical protein B4168_3739 [Anoxybacillus flavithermus]|nr:hypothetical protein B4168_3739 [Anoxybacillus flavithermus]OAO88074.1 hypothetical protein GT23_0807 [Parageobacillus thermoglucosidasius]
MFRFPAKFFINFLQGSGKARRVARAAVGIGLTTDLPT